MADEAARHWAAALGEWAIPDAILAAAPESPWSLPPALFAQAAEQAGADTSPRPSRQRAREALPAGGEVIDVGVGGGAASLPLAPEVRRIIGVDQSEAMLATFAEAAERQGTDHAEILGLWPDVAAGAGTADVVVCHHVAYNVADLVPFAGALSAAARRRVVLELTAEHPLTGANALWRAVHGVERPSSPVAADAVAVLEEVGLDIGMETFERPSLWVGIERAELVAFVRRRLCVGPERDTEIDALLAEHPPPDVRSLVTVWWDTRR